MMTRTNIEVALATIMPIVLVALYWLRWVA